MYGKFGRIASFVYLTVLLEKDILKILNLSILIPNNMKIRTIHALLIMVTSMAIIVSCEKKQPVIPEYIVEGIADSTYNGQKIYLVDHNRLGNNKIDSVLIDSNKFVFKGIADTIRYAGVFIEDGAYVPLILDTGRIIVNLKDGIASNTPLNDALTDYNKKTGELYKERENIYTELKNKIKDKDKFKAEFDSIFIKVWTPKYMDLMENTFDANTNNVIGSVVLYEMSMWMRTGQIDTAVAKLSKDIASLEMVKKIVGTNDALKKTAEGQKFSDFTIEQPDGKKVSLSDYAGKGKYILVDFWASWCGPCRGETPNMKEIYKKYKGDKFEIVGIAVWDKPEDTQKAIAEDKVEWPQIINAQEIPTKMYGVRGIPHIILIGPDGTILARNLRGDAMKSRVARELDMK